MRLNLRHNPHLSGERLVRLVSGLRRLLHGAGGGSAALELDLWTPRSKLTCSDVTRAYVQFVYGPDGRWTAAPPDGGGGVARLLSVRVALTRSTDLLAEAAPRLRAQLGAFAAAHVATCPDVLRLNVHVE